MSDGTEVRERASLQASAQGSAQASAQGSAQASAQVARLADRYWAFERHETPLLAALGSEPLVDAVLFRESQADHARRDQRAAELLVDLDRVDAAAVVGQERATLGLLRRELEGIRAHYRVAAHLRPSLFPAGPDFTAVFWANSAAVVDEASATGYVDRLAGLPAYFSDVQANIDAGQALGFRYPRAVLERAAANTCGILAAAGDASAWFGPFKRSPALRQPGVQRQADRALQVIADRLVPALRDYAAWLAGPLAAAAKESLSCTDTADGRAFYAVLVRHFTTTDMTPDAVHALGLAEVARLEAEIGSVAAQAGFADDLAGYRRFLRTDPRFVSASKEALRESIESLCKRIDKLIPAWFGHIPRITYGVASMPEAMSAAMPPAYAQPAPADGSSAGVFWVSGLPEKCPSYLHVALAVHEAWPGHLMHIALIQEAIDVPAFRRFGSVKYTACIEGWALYCESLGVEMGLYDTPHRHYGRLEMEMWRAVRLVVDTGIHWHGWSRDRAIAYMAERLTLSSETIAGEVDRYAALPAQALGYQIGNLHLRALRRRAEAALGDRFKARHFHTAVMTAGAVTLPVLTGLVDDWLARQDAARPVAA